MKCRYAYCKYGGEVNKEDAVKEGNSYYHKDCLKEKKLKLDIANFYIENMPKCTNQILNKVIKTLIHENNHAAEYVLFVLKYIKKNNKTLNSPFGLIRYCNNINIQKEYKKIKINEKYKNIKDNTLKIDEKQTVFNYKPNDNWFNIL